MYALPEEGVPIIFTIFIIVITPVLELYDCTVPSNLSVNGLTVSETTTELPGVYANCVPIVNVASKFDKLNEVSTDVEVELYLSPGRP